MSALAGIMLAAFSLPAPAQETVHTDLGDIDKTARREAVSRRSGPIRLGPAAISRRGRCSATRICTPRFSLDAGAVGARLGPKEAYRFAKGEEVTSSTGQPAKLSRPLDFLVVADHSDNMGFFPDLLAGKPEMLADPTGRKWYDMMQSGKGAEAAMEIIVAFSQGTFPKDLMYLPGNAAYRPAWQEHHRRGRRSQRSGALHRLHRL